MKRTLLSFALVLACACTRGSTTTTLPTAVVTSPPAGLSPSAAASTPTPTNPSQWTILPYRVTDGMEYGPSHAVLKASGKLAFEVVADVPDKSGYSFLVRVKENDPMPEKYNDVADFVWPAWKVDEVIAERREDSSVYWTAPVVLARFEDTAKCAQVTIFAFESHTFCTTIAPKAHHEPSLVFLPFDFYPVPQGGAALKITPVPKLAAVSIR